MTHRIVEESEVERVLDFLRDSAGAIGAAKARLVKAGHYLKHVEALEFLAAEGGSAEARKSAARVTDNYMEAMNEEAIAAGEYEKLKALREAATMKIEAWRSEQATYRSMKL